MKKLLFVCLLFPVIGFSQTFHITGLSVSSYGRTVPKIYKTNSKVIISDSTITMDFKGKQTTYQITKKVDSSYFKCTDGLKDFIIKVNRQKILRYSGFINEESGDNIATMWFQ